MNTGQTTTVGIGLIVGAIVLAVWIVARSAAPGQPAAAATAAARPAGAVPDFKFVRIEPGTFLMSDAGDPEDPQHSVTLTRPFDLAAYPVTVDQFARFAAATGHRTRAEVTGIAYVQQPKLGNLFASARGVTWRTMGAEGPPTCPVVCVSWTDATAYCSWASGVTGRRVRLPTEAEWEYACRAGTTGPFNVDDVPPTDLGWFADNSGDHPFDALRLARQAGAAAFYDRVNAEHCRPHPVGQKRPNAWGLYDMHGNCWQLCQDARGPYPAGPVTDPTGPADPKPRYRRGRGCGFCDPPSVGTSYNRGWWSPDAAYFHIGFRVAADVP